MDDIPGASGAALWAGPSEPHLHVPSPVPRALGLTPGDLAEHLEGQLGVGLALMPAFPLSFSEPLPAAFMLPL